MQKRKVTIFLMHSNNQKRLAKIGQGVHQVVEKKGLKLLGLNRGDNIVVGLLDGHSANLRTLFRSAGFKFMENFAEARTVGVHPLAPTISFYFSRKQTTLDYLLEDVNNDLFHLIGWKGMRINKEITELSIEAHEDTLAPHESVPFKKMGYMGYMAAGNYHQSDDFEQIAEIHAPKGITTVEFNLL